MTQRSFITFALAAIRPHLRRIINCAVASQICRSGGCTGSPPPRNRMRVAGFFFCYKNRKQNDDNRGPDGVFSSESDKNDQQPVPRRKSWTRQRLSGGFKSQHLCTGNEVILMTAQDGDFFVGLFRGVEPSAPDETCTKR